MVICSYGDEESIECRNDHCDNAPMNINILPEIYDKGYIITTKHGVDTIIRDIDL